MTRTVEQVLADQTKEESANELVELHMRRLRRANRGGADASRRGLGDHRRLGAELYVSARSTLNPNQLEFVFVQDVLRNQYADYAKTEAFLCFHCIEQRLRRRLTQEDLIPG